MAMMSPKAGNGLYRPLAEINVTPLVDVMLVLLIIFMVTAPMLASGMKVNLPQAKQIQPLDPKAPIIITVGKDSTITLGSDTIERDKLIDAIQAKLAGDTMHVIHLRGDKEAAYGDVVAIMDLLATNGLTHIAIVADPHSKQDSLVRSEIQVKTPPATTGPDTQVKPSDADSAGTPGSVNATDPATSAVSSAAALPPPAPIAPSMSGASQP